MVSLSVNFNGNSGLINFLFRFSYESLVCEISNQVTFKDFEFNYFEFLLFNFVVSFSNFAIEHFNL